jgi:hypothetical protein
MACSLRQITGKKLGEVLTLSEDVGSLYFRGSCVILGIKESKIVTMCVQRYQGYNYELLLISVKLGVLYSQK